MKLKNIWLAFKDQLPLKRIWKNLRNGRITGLLHIRSHVNANGKPKIKYNTKATAVKSAAAMADKVGVPFGNWKCVCIVTGTTLERTGQKMNERDQYPNLPADVSIHHCTSENPMPIEIADRVRELKQLWIHDGARETEESIEMDGSYIIMNCPNCGHTYGCYVGD